MKGTTKAAAPQVLIDWWNVNRDDPSPSWAALQNPEKSDILLALLNEQKFVCVYCGTAISAAPGSAHIEHFWPSSKFSECRFDWSNLFASCGPSAAKRQPKTCGDAKANWTPCNYIDPTDIHCERKFAYDGIGRIKPSASGGGSAAIMIDRLKLDQGSLNYQRSQIIGDLEREIINGTINAVTVAKEILLWRETDVHGHLKAFGHVAARYLEDEQI